MVLRASAAPESMAETLQLKYDVEADFCPLTTCDFRCAYCRLSPADRGAKVRVYGTNAQWQEGFDATGKIWLIHTTGGEPFIYPDFVDLCDRLSRRHYLSINSNLSGHRIHEFAAMINPERVHFINASVHYEERQKRRSLEAFIASVRLLQNARFAVLVSLVMTPHIVHNFSAISSSLAASGVAIVPKMLCGYFRGMLYPPAYSAEEKAVLREALAEARANYASVLKRMDERPTIDMFSDSQFLDGWPNYLGRLCGSGYNFVVITPDGSVGRCGSGQRLGNLLAQNVRLLSGPKPCDVAYCHYFCEKYTSYCPAAVSSG